MLRKEIEKTPVFDSTFHSYDFKISKTTCVKQFLTTTETTLIYVCLKNLFRDIILEILKS